LDEADIVVYVYCVPDSDTLKLLLTEADNAKQQLTCDNIGRL